MLYGAFAESGSSVVKIESYSGTVLRAAVQHCYANKPAELLENDKECDAMMAREIVSLVSAADYCDLPTLKHKAERWVNCKMLLQPSLALVILTESRAVGEMDLLDRAVAVIRANKHRLINSKEFIDLSHEVLETFSKVESRHVWKDSGTELSTRWGKGYAAELLDCEPMCSGTHKWSTKVESLVERDDDSSESSIGLGVAAALLVGNGTDDQFCDLSGVESLAREHNSCSEGFVGLGVAAVSLDDGTDDQFHDVCYFCGRDNLHHNDGDSLCYFRNVKGGLPKLFTEGSIVSFTLNLGEGNGTLSAAVDEKSVKSDIAISESDIVHVA